MKTAVAKRVPTLQVLAPFIVAVATVATMLVVGTLVVWWGRVFAPQMQGGYMLAYTVAAIAGVVTAGLTARVFYRT